MKQLCFFLLIGLAFTPDHAFAQCAKTSLYFDGVDVNNAHSPSNDHVDLSTYGPMSTIESGVSYTIEAWVKRDIISNPGGYERIISKDFTYQFRVVDDKFVGEIGTSLVQTPYPADKDWHHLAFVRDATSSTLKLYLDGQLKATAPDNSTAIANNGAPVCIGARNNGSGEINELWKGNIRWLRVSKTVRYQNNFSPTDILAKDNNTLALWPFDAVAGTYLQDLTGSHNGTIVNATWVTETEIPPAQPTLSAQSTNLYAGLSTTISASGCSGTLAWGTGQSASSISVRPYATTTYAARCVNATGCASAAAEITIQVEGIMPTISISANPGDFIQQGESVTFSAAITNGGSSPLYQWQKNGIAVGSNSPTYSDSQLNSGDKVRCILTSNAPCRQLDKILSNEVKILVPELSSGGSCGNGTLALNNLPYTEIRWKKNGQYIENPVLGSRGSGVAVIGNIDGAVLKTSSVFVDEAGATYAPSNKGILKIAPDGEERIVIPVADRGFFRSRSGSFYLPYEDRVEKWEIGDTQGVVVAGGNGIGSNANQLSISSDNVQTLQVTESGVIYIADIANKRVQRWNLGAFEGVTVAQGDEVGYMLFVDKNENLFTVSNGTIFKWLANVAGPIPAFNYQNLESSTTLTALKGDDEGNLYAVLYSYKYSYLYKFNSNGITKIYTYSSVGSGVMTIIYGLDVAVNKNIYLNITGGNYNGIYELNSNLESRQVRGKNFSNASNISSPKDVFVDKQGNIFTVGEDLVQKWNPGSTAGLTVAGGNGIGSAANQLSFPADVVVDNEGNVYVADRNNYRVQKWSPGSASGVTVAGGNGSGTATNQLSSPNRIFLDSDKTLYIADGSRVQKWTSGANAGTTVIDSPFNSYISSIFVKSDTIYVARGGSVERRAPGASSSVQLCGINVGYYADIHLDSRNNVYYSDYDYGIFSTYNDLVRRWSPIVAPINGCEAGKVDTLTQANSLRGPNGIFVDSLANLYVADTQNNRVKKFLATASTLKDTTGGTYTAEVTIGTRTLTLNVSASTETTCESQKSGDWNDAATWACGHVPLPCELVIIGSQHTISLTQAVQISGLEIKQDGQLSLQGGNMQLSKL